MRFVVLLMSFVLNLAATLRNIVIVRNALMMIKLILHFKWMLHVVWCRKSRRTQQIVCNCLNRLVGKFTFRAFKIIGECNEIGVYLKYDDLSEKFQVKSFKEIIKQ